MRHTAVDRCPFGNRPEVDAGSLRLAALTEQGRMAGRSIVTPVERGRSPGDQLDLGVADGAMFMREIADLVVLEIQLDIEIEEIDDLLRHQAQGPVDVLVAVQRIGVRVAW